MGAATCACSAKLQQQHANAGLHTPMLTGPSAAAAAQVEVWPDHEVQAEQRVPSDPLWGSGNTGLWGMRRIQAPQAWALQSGEGSTVTVCVADTGIGETGGEGGGLRSAAMHTSLRPRPCWSGAVPVRALPSPWYPLLPTRPADFTHPDLAANM